MINQVQNQHAKYTKCRINFPMPQLNLHQYDDVGAGIPSACHKDVVDTHPLKSAKLDHFHPTLDVHLNLVRGKLGVIRPHPSSKSTFVKKLKALFERGFGSWLLFFFFCPFTYIYICTQTLATSHPHASFHEISSTCTGHLSLIFC